MTVRFKAWHVLPLLWGALVAFLIYRDIKARAFSAPNGVFDAGSRLDSNGPIASPATPSPSSRVSPVIEKRRPEPGPPDTGFAAIPATIGPTPAEEDGQFTPTQEQDPNEPEAPSEPETADSNKEDQAQILADLHESLRQDPDNVDAKFKIAEILTHDKWDADASEKAEAEKYYTDLLQLYPDHADVRNGLATLYIQTNRTEQAIELWSQETPQDTPQASPQEP